MVHAAVLVLACASCRSSLPTVTRATEREFTREVSVKALSRNGTPRVIDVRAGIAIPLEQFWTRYEPFFHVSPAALVRTGTPRVDTTDAAKPMLIAFQQVYRGYPVSGYGYTVAVERDMVRWARGKFMLDLEANLGDLLQPISERAATEAAMAAAKFYPNATFAPGAIPAAERRPRRSGYLSLSPNRLEPGPKDFRLTWYIDLVGTGWLEPAGVELNAVTGDVYFMEPGSIR